MFLLGKLERYIVISISLTSDLKNGGKMIGTLKNNN